MKRILLGIILVLLTTFCQASKVQHEIKITGNVIGYPFNTKVILINFDSQTRTDTSYIMNGFFNFSILNSEPAYYGIQIGNEAKTERLNFFVEDSDISIFAKSDELEKAIVKGGKVQSDFDYFTLINEPITNRYNAAHEEFKQAFKGNDKEKADSLKKEVFSLRQERIDFGADYIIDYPDNLLSAFLLKGYIPGLPKTKVDSLYDNLFPRVKASNYANDVATFLEKSKEVNVGDMAKEFELLDVNGNKVNLKNFKDKFIILDFWAAGCKSCRVENKNLLKYYQRYKNKGLEIISISSDKNPAEWKLATKEDGIIWASLQDSQYENGYVRFMYDVKFIPSSFIIEPGGRIIAKNLKGEVLKEKLENIFK